MAVANEQLNPEIQDLYGRKAIAVPRVAEDGLKLDTFIPSRGNLVIEPIPAEEQTKGGVFLPEIARADKSVGWVVAVHPEERIFLKGDLVFYRFGAGQGVTIEGRNVVIVQYTDRISDILGHWPASCVERIAPEAAPPSDGEPAGKSS
jgi:co-chaperonin GroES (HSP10)